MAKSGTQIAAEARMEQRREEDRARVRAAFRDLYQQVIESELAPEGIEFYQWRQLPFAKPLPLSVKLFVDPDQPRRAMAAAEAAASYVDEDVIEIRPAVRGTVRVALHTGDIVIPYWIGWHTYHRIAAVCSGAASLT